MNVKSLTDHYAVLTPEERFKLILNAGARGDEAEQKRLTRAGGRVTLSMPEHAPAAHAFHELAMLTFLELLDEAGRYADALHLDAKAGDDHLKNDLGEDDETDDGSVGPGGAGAASEVNELAECDRLQREMDRSLGLVLAAGCVFREKVRGWERFCEQIGVPAFSCWEFLPGWERFQRLRKAAEHMAYMPEGFVAWFNRIRDPADPELKRIRTAEHYADEATVIYQDRLRWWAGA